MNRKTAKITFSTINTDVPSAERTEFNRQQDEMVERAIKTMCARAAWLQSKRRITSGPLLMGVVPGFLDSNTKLNNFDSRVYHAIMIPDVGTEKPEAPMTTLYRIIDNSTGLFSEGEWNAGWGKTGKYFTSKKEVLAAWNRDYENVPCCEILAYKLVKMTPGSCKITPKLTTRY